MHSKTCPWGTTGSARGTAAANAFAASDGGCRERGAPNRRTVRTPLGQSSERATDGRENVVSEEDRRPTEGFLIAAAVGAVMYLLLAVVLL